MPLQMRGVSGELRKGYRVVAQLGTWKMDESGRVEATPLEINDFLLDQGGAFALWLRLGQRAWVWREADVADPGSPFVVRVNGRPEVRDM